AEKDDGPGWYLIMPNPETRQASASGTCEPSGCEVSWRMASTSPRNPPAAPACPTESWPPEVLCGNVPSLVSVWDRTKSGPSPLGQKPRSSNCIIDMTG